MHLSYSHNHGHISICINSPQALTHLWLGAFWKFELSLIYTWKDSGGWEIVAATT